MNPILSASGDRYASEGKRLIEKSHLFLQQHCDKWDEAFQCAQLLLELEADPESIATVLLLPTLNQTDLTLDDIKAHFGTGIAKLLEGVLKMQAMDSMSRHSHASKIAENVREMLLGMADDMRVVLIKLVQQTQLMHQLEMLPASEQQHIAERTMLIYAPLANRLGIHKLKWQLEDLSFRYLEPETYQAIAEQLQGTHLERESKLKEGLEAISTVLISSSVLRYEIEGRVKHLYSIHKKMQRKGVAFKDIWDGLAIRVIVDDIEACYQVLSLVHSQWDFIPEEFDDYIALPKKNGYQSIHTVFYLHPNAPMELQIRTQHMHTQNEVGVAAHWIYKEGTPERVGYEERIAWLRQLLEWQQDLEHAPALSHVLSKGMLADRIFVFTPRGDTIALPLGSTPLDFAYQLHTDLGHRCRGAKVLGKIVPLTYQLKTGDRIEILTHKEAHPSRDWLRPQAGYLKSSSARAKVKLWFKKNDEALTTSALVTSSTPVEKALTIAAAPRSTVLPGQIQSSEVSLEGMTNLLTRMAACCKPLFEDPILGYVTKRNGISIHRESCSVILQHQLQRPEQVLKASWVPKRERK